MFRKKAKGTNININVNPSDNFVAVAVIAGGTVLIKEAMSIVGGAAIALYDNARISREEKKTAKKKKDAEE